MEALSDLAGQADAVLVDAPCSGTGTNEPGSQLGQVVHPSPEPVRRTAPPVPTMTICETRVAQAAAIRPRERSSTVHLSCRSR